MTIQKIIKEMKDRIKVLEHREHEIAEHYLISDSPDVQKKLFAIQIEKKKLQGMLYTYQQSPYK